MRRTIAVGIGVGFVLSGFLALAEQQRLPLISGESPTDLLAKDIAEIVSLTTTKASTPWLVNVEKMKWCWLGSTRVSVYLKPNVSTSRLRRGKFVLCFAEKRPGQEAKNWQLADEKCHYAQVSLKDKTFASDFTLPSGVDRPFSVTGKIRDSDLIALVDFIRTSPGMPVKGVCPGTVEGNDPIMSVEEEARGSYKIMTEIHEGMGQSITVKLQDDGWKLLQIGIWIS